MKITMIKTVDLKPYPNNPRKNDQSIDFVANSIKEFGFKVPIVVDGEMGAGMYKGKKKGPEAHY